MSGHIGEFQSRGCDVLGISTDDIETHSRWLTTQPEDGGLGPIAFPLAADPEGTVCQQYGVYVERQRLALRGLFLVDPNGVLQYQVVHSLSVGRNTEEILRVLDALQSGGLCPGERQVNGPTLDVAANLQPGRVLGPYKIEAELGSGSFGTVVRAHDKLLDREVALKILRQADDDSHVSLLAEARAAAALNHPNVCAVHTIDTSNGAEMIVMEYVEGRPLSEVIRNGALSVEQAAGYGRQIAAGMASAHDAGVIHGDLKPANLVVTADDTIKIMDFGLSRRVLPQNLDEDTLPHSTGSNSGGLSGTVGYLAPERARGEAPTAAADTFAVGLVIYEMLTGQRAIQGSNLIDTLRRVEEFDPSEHVSTLPDSMKQLAAQTLARSPDQRPSMQSLAEALGGLKA